MLWKIYFWAYYISILGTSLFLSNLNSITPSKLILLIMQIISFVGIYTFIWGSHLRQKIIWRIIFLLNIIELGLFILYRFTSFSFFSYYFTYIKAENTIFSVISTFFALPLCFILYTLSYKNLEKNKEKKSVPVSKLAIFSMLVGFFSAIPIPFLGIIAFITGIIALIIIHKNDTLGKILAWMGVIQFFFTTLLFIAGVTFVTFLMRGPALYYTGARAIENMNQQELQFLNTKLGTITGKSSPQEVQQILGKPVDIKISYLISSYYFSCSYLTYSLPYGNCSIKIDFANNKAIKISWLDIKKFNYTRQL